MLPFTTPINRSVDHASLQRCLYPDAWEPSPDEVRGAFRYRDIIRFIDTTSSVVDADVTHRRHTIIETVFADFIDGPVVHMPSGKFRANSVLVLYAAIARNLLRATDVLAGVCYSRAREAGLRRKIVEIPARLRQTERKPLCDIRALALVGRMASIEDQHHRPQNPS